MKTYLHFCDVHFSLGKRHILKTWYVKRHAFLVDPLGDLFDFRMFTLRCFFDPKKGRPKPRKGLEIKLPHRNFERLALPKRAHSDQKKEPKEGHSGFLRDARGPGRPATPVAVEIDLGVSRRHSGLPPTGKSPSPPRPPSPPLPSRPVPSHPLPSPPLPSPPLASSPSIPEQERVEFLSDANAEKADLTTLAQLTNPERRPPAPRDPFLAGQPQFLRGHSSSRGVLPARVRTNPFAGEPLVLRYSAM